MNDAFWECKFCSFVDVCHHGECVEVNCRSCKYAEPVMLEEMQGEWHCNMYGCAIPKDFVAKGCNKHVSINE